MIKTLIKIFGGICLFFLVSGAYFLLKPSPEDKALDAQMKMYPIGFHCTDDSGGEQVIKVDMKSQLAIYKDIYKYSMEKAMYRDGEKKPFGCKLLITGNGIKRVVMIYVADVPVNLDEVRFENSTDKDLIYQVVSKSVKKEKTTFVTEWWRTYEQGIYRNLGRVPGPLSRPGVCQNKEADLCCG